MNLSMNSKGESNPLSELLGKIVRGKVDANRRYVDQVLEKIVDANHRFYLDRLVGELQMAEVDEKAGALRSAYCHQTLALVYKGILEKTFAASA